MRPGNAAPGSLGARGPGDPGAQGPSLVLSRARRGMLEMMVALRILAAGPLFGGRSPVWGAV